MTVLSFTASAHVSTALGPLAQGEDAVRSARGTGRRRDGADMRGIRAAALRRV
jgi:hypothetical protein